MPLQDMIRFPAMGDWGGTEYLNYYVPTQEWNAGLMDDLCANDSYSIGNSAHALLDRYDLDGAIIGKNPRFPIPHSGAQYAFNTVGDLGSPFLHLKNVENRAKKGRLQKTDP